MKKHNWKNTYWKDEQGNTVTIHDLLFKLQDEPTIEVELSDLAHIPSTYVEEHRKLVANLSLPIIVQEKDSKYQRILDGHHRRQKAIDEKRTWILAKIFRGELFSESR